MASLDVVHFASVYNLAPVNRLHSVVCLLKIIRWLKKSNVLSSNKTLALSLLFIIHFQFRHL